MGEKIIAYKIMALMVVVVIVVVVVVVVVEGKRQLGKTRRRVEGHFKIILENVGCGCADQCHLNQNHRQLLVSTVMNFWFHKILGIS
jgi:F0F1-type ATP synthase membrane subunit a